MKVIVILLFLSFISYITNTVFIHFYFTFSFSYFREMLPWQQAEIKYIIYFPPLYLYIFKDFRILKFISFKVLISSIDCCFWFYLIYFFPDFVLKYNMTFLTDFVRFTFPLSLLFCFLITVDFWKYCKYYQDINIANVQMMWIVWSVVRFWSWLYEPRFQTWSGSAAALLPFTWATASAAGSSWDPTTLRYVISQYYFTMLMYDIFLY